MTPKVRIITLLCAAVMWTVGIACSGGEEMPASDATSPGPPERPPPSVRVERVTEGVVERTVAFTGEVRADVRVDVAAVESGRLDELTVDVGDHVVADQLIATLDRDVQRSTRDERRRDLHTATAQVDVARAELVQHRAELDRRRVLADRGAFTRAELQALDDRVPVLEANVELAESRESAARTRLASVDAMFDRREIRSPFDGVVVHRHVVAGAAVAPQTALVTIVDPSSLEFVGRVPERTLAHVDVGHEVRVTIDALGADRVTGTVRRLGGDIDRDSRTIEIRVGFDDDTVRERVLDGMFGRGAIVLERDEGAVVPVEALTRGPGGRSVWTVDDEGVAHRVDASVGLEDESHATVAELSPGARVVLRPPRGIADGAPVIVVGDAADGSGAGGPR